MTVFHCASSSQRASLYLRQPSHATANSCFLSMKLAAWCCKLTSTEANPQFKGPYTDKDLRMTDRHEITGSFRTHARSQPALPGYQLLGLYDLDAGNRSTPTFEETTTDGTEQSVRSRAGPRRAADPIRRAGNPGRPRHAVGKGEGQSSA